MKKKICIVLIAIALLVPSFAFAQMFDISLGATAQYGANPLADPGKGWDWSGMGKIENWSFGGELRLKVTLLEIDVVGLYNQYDAAGTTNHVISGMFTGGLSLDLFDVVRLGVGMGPNISWNITQNKFVLGESQLSSFNDFGEGFMTAPMNYRATADVMLGPVMLGVNYTVPTTFTFKAMEAKNLKPLWDYGRFGVSVLVSFF
ncbi:MAG: hypothetical protein SPD11_11965 [Sphaerochaetaceae bacterium]|nr:hypothetical protein [Sphaerochaetaceae bacterium]